LEISLQECSHNRYYILINDNTPCYKYRILELICQPYRSLIINIDVEYILITII